jgi:peptide/nickel transport system permease protein
LSLRGSLSNRILQYVGVFLVAVTINFMLPRLMPGNPLALLAGVDVGMMTPAERAQVVKEAGLDRPLWQQYATYLKDVVRLDFGYSYRQKRLISDMILERLPWTLLLAGVSLFLSAVIGVVLGGISAWNRAKAMDVGMLWTMIGLESLPTFWLGMMLISVVSVRLGWLPSFGISTPGIPLTGWPRVVDVARHLVLPVITLTIISMPGIYVTMRYSMLSVLGSDFIRTARAKGLTERTVLFRHVVRNAIVPVATVLALRLGFAFGGAVVTETVFSFPGIGRLTFEAVSGRDYPVMMACFMVITVAVLVSNLAVDLIYPLLDPRMR